MSVHTIDCAYFERPRVAAAYLLVEGDQAAFIETNTRRSVPRLLQALEGQGLGPEQVRWIIVTHVHLDHAGGASSLLERCPNATLLAHPRAAPHLIDPSKLIKSAQAVYGEARFAELYGTIPPAPTERVRIMGDNEVLEFGGRTLTFLHTRGHANHHFCVHDSGTHSLFTGDSFGVIYPALMERSTLGKPLAVPSTSPTDFDGEAALQSLDRILTVGADRVYPTHYGAFTDIAELAEQLRALIEVSTEIVESAFASDRSEEQVEAYCQERVDALFEELLREHGLSEDEEARALLEVDRSLNAQGLAFAVKKKRYKAKKARDTVGRS